MPEYLTDASIRRLTPSPDGRVEVADEDTPGLRLRVAENGSKTFSFWYRNRAGEAKRYALGAYPDLSLAKARRAARRLGVVVDAGSDPQAERQAERKAAKVRRGAGTFADLCDDFIADQADEWRPVTRISWTRYIEREVKPALGTKRPEEITGDDIQDLVESIKKRGALVSAARCYEVVRRLCAWAVWKKRLAASPCEAAKPFERRRRKRSRAAARAKAYTDQQLRAIFTASAGTELENLLGLIAHTAVRAHEARSARREDVDDEQSLWRVPPEFHKTGDETGAPHLVPLSTGALRVIARIREANMAAGQADSPWLFPAPTTKCDVCDQAGHADKPNKAVAAVKEKAGITDRGLLHRLRDTIKTRMSEHGIDARVSEAVLGHVVPGIAGTYDHAEVLPQRREALEWWSAELERILGERRVADVVPITSSRRA